MKTTRDPNTGLRLVDGATSLEVRFVPVVAGGAVYEIWQDPPGDGKWYARTAGSGDVVVPGARTRDLLMEALDNREYVPGHNDNGPQGPSAPVLPVIRSENGMQAAIPLSFIQDNPWNPREHYPEADVIKLAMSVRELLHTRRDTLGLLHPPLARLVSGPESEVLDPAALSASELDSLLASGEARVQLADGHKRKRAFALSARGFEHEIDDQNGTRKKLAPAEEAHKRLVVELGVYSDRQMAEIAGRENSDRSDMTWWEQAGGMIRFMADFRATQAEVGPIFGLETQSAVSQYVRAREAIETLGDPYLSELARSDRLPLKTARVLVPLLRDYPDAARQFIADGKLTGEDGEVLPSREIDDKVKALIAELNRGEVIDLPDLSPPTPGLTWSGHYFDRDKKQVEDDDQVLMVKTGRYYVALNKHARRAADAAGVTRGKEWYRKYGDADLDGSEADVYLVSGGPSTASVKGIAELLDAGMDVLVYEDESDEAANFAKRFWTGIDPTKKSTPSKPKPKKESPPKWLESFRSNARVHKDRLFTYAVGSLDSDQVVAIDEHARTIAAAMRQPHELVGVGGEDVAMLLIDLSDEATKTWFTEYREEHQVMKPALNDKAFVEFVEKTLHGRTYTPPLSEEEKQAKVEEKMANIFGGQRPAPAAPPLQQQRATPPPSEGIPPVPPAAADEDLPDWMQDEPGEDVATDPLAARYARAAHYLALARDEIELAEQEAEDEIDILIADGMARRVKHTISPMQEMAAVLSDEENLSALRAKLWDADEDSRGNVYRQWLLNISRRPSEARVHTPSAQRGLFDPPADGDMAEAA